MNEENPISQTQSEETDYIPSKVAIKTDYRIDDHAHALGVTFLGRQHQEYKEVCQDYHLFEDLGDGWHLYVVSDGAGSAKASDRGARTNCDITALLLKTVIEKLGWKSKESLPTEVDWHIEFYAICRKLKDFIEEKVSMLDEPVIPKDFNATLLVLVVTPWGIMSGHIGDGRMGYKDNSGEWHNIMTPHKGEEPNQTVFMLNNWDKICIPSFKMSGVSVPETSVICEMPQVVAILSDGCENFCWECIALNEDTGRYEDRNRPFVGFWEPLEKMLKESKENLFDNFAKFVDSSSDASRYESDDRTLMVGLYCNDYTKSGDIIEEVVDSQETVPELAEGDEEKSTIEDETVTVLS